MPRWLTELRINVASGLHLALLRRRAPARFRISLDQLLLLVGVDAALGFAMSLLASLPRPAFNAYAFPSLAFQILTLLFALYLAGKLFFGSRTALRTGVLFYSALPLFHLVWLGLALVTWPAGEAWVWAPWAAYFGWVIVVLFRAMQISVGEWSRRLVGAFALVLVLGVAPAEYFGGPNFWYRDTPASEPVDRYAPYRELDAEAMFYRQPDLLDASLKALAPQRRGTADLYFLGFAGWARQDVFLKEVRFVQDLFEQRFEAAGRSLLLANHLATQERVPLATATNLQRALAGIGRRMDVEEDVLVLFLTSHGSEDHRLAVDFWPLPLNDLSPERLRRHLDEAGIKWRILVVSACYSGGFVGPLKDPHTLVITASAPDRRSFGCSNANDFTYFGEAFFKDQLSHEHSLVTAFEQAADSIARRERREGLAASQPQLFVGEAVQGKLAELQGVRHAGEVAASRE